MSCWGKIGTRVEAGWESNSRDCPAKIGPVGNYAIIETHSSHLNYIITHYMYNHFLFHQELRWPPVEVMLKCRWWLERIWQLSRVVQVNIIGKCFVLCIPGVIMGSYALEVIVLVVVGILLVSVLHESVLVKGRKHKQNYSIF